jgi:hypothetical protein
MSQTNFIMTIDEMIVTLDEMITSGEFNLTFIKTCHRIMVDIVKTTVTFSQNEKTFILRISECYMKLSSFVPMSKEEIIGRTNILKKMQSDNNIDKKYVMECHRNTRKQMKQVVDTESDLMILFNVIRDCRSNKKNDVKIIETVTEKITKITKLIENGQTDNDYVNECLNYVDEHTSEEQANCKVLLDLSIKYLHQD